MNGKQIIAGTIPPNQLGFNPGVENAYTSLANLLADQANQTTGLLQRLSISGNPSIWLEKLSTSTGSKTDYIGFPIYEESFLLTGDNQTIRKSSFNKNRIITGINIEAASPVSVEGTFDIQVDGSTILSTPAVIAQGDKYCRNLSLVTSTVNWNAFIDLDFIIPSTGVVITAEILNYHFGDVVDFPLTPLSSPSIGAVDVDSSSALTVHWSNNTILETGFDIIYDTVNTFDSTPQTVTAAAGATSKQLTGLTPDVLVYIKVKAKGDGITNSDSPWSGLIWGTPASILYVVNDNYLDMQPWVDPTIPDGYLKGGTHNATNFVEEASGGMRFVSDGTVVQAYKSSVLTPNQDYNYEILVDSWTSGTMQIGKFISPSTYTSALTISSAGLKTGVANFGDYTQMVWGRINACDMVIRYIKLWV